MKLITIDFETYYSADIGFAKQTTEEYVRDPEFHVIGVAVKVDDGETEWASGTHEQLKTWLGQFDWAGSVVLAHNAMFDGSILNWHFDIRPKFWVDTLCMGRAVCGVEVSGSLAALADRYGLGKKGTEVVTFKGYRRTDFQDFELEKYGDYCINDVNLTYQLFQKMINKFPKKELHIINQTLRMFTEPVLTLDKLLLESHLHDVQAAKEKLLAEVGIDKAELMSNPKFADALRALGVEPPMKISATTGKATLALAKNDEEFKALADHESPLVQALVAARLGAKSTLEETRTQRFLGIHSRGSLPVPIKYYAAHTGRFGGDDKINLQNLPSRGNNANKLKHAIRAPEGYTIIDADSAQIEARVLAWLSDQEDLVQAFINKEDVYKKMASAIYGKPEADITKDERFVGKTTILGCISEGTLVLSDSGWKPIEEVSLQNKLWDGEEWVCHQGLVRKGYKETLNVCGVWLTPDHKILCGVEWKEAQLVAQDENILCRALGTSAENLPLRAMSKGYGVGWLPLLLSVVVGNSNTQWVTTTLKTLRVLDAIYALKNQVTRLGNYIGATATCSKITSTVNAYSTVYLAAYHAAIQSLMRCTYITVVGGLQFTNRGVKTGKSFYDTLFHSVAGITQNETLTASITAVGTNQIIYGLRPDPKTREINEELVSYKRNLMTYDIAYAGPRNRFLIATNKGPLLVHNCGFGMGALKFQGQLKTFGVDISIDEGRRIIDIYRKTNGQVVALWRQAQNALIAMSRNESCTLGRAGVLEVITRDNSVKLPSGLMMRYDDLSFTRGEQGVEFSYKTRKGRVRIYGGKVIENVCQAIARCIIAEQMLKIGKRHKVVITVHDAIGCVVPDAEVVEARAYVEECMRWTPEWAAGLPVNCESGSGKSYGEC